MLATQRTVDLSMGNITKANNSCHIEPSPRVSLPNLYGELMAQPVLKQIARSLSPLNCYNT